MSTKILIADSHWLDRKGLEKSVSEFSLDAQITTCSNAVEMLHLLKEEHFDVLVVDYAGELLDFSDLLKVMDLKDRPKILTITDQYDENSVVQSNKVGIEGQVTKECSEEEVEEAIEALLNGEKFLCGKISALIKDEEAESCDGIVLSQRELEIISMIANGSTNKDIAESLCLSAHTVNTHRKNIMAKLGINNTAGLVLYAVKSNLISPNKFLFNVSEN